MNQMNPTNKNSIVLLAMLGALGSIAACGGAPFEVGDLVDIRDAGIQDVGTSDAIADNGVQADARADVADVALPDVIETQDGQDGQGERDGQAAQDGAQDCSIGETVCASPTTLRTCHADGWESSSCPYVCLNGACGGVCVPGAIQQCSECANDGTQTCDANGQWGACSVSC